MLIIFSGIDSAGKSTQIDNLKKYYKEKGKNVKVVWSRGGYTPNFNFFKKVLRLTLKNKIPKPGHSTQRDQIFENKFISNLWLILALLDMLFLYAFVFRLFSNIGYIVIADRILWDTFIDYKLKYKSFNIENKLLWRLLVFFTPKPDCSFIITIPPQVSLERSKLKKEPFSESLNKRKKRINQYLNLIKEKKWDYTIDGSESILSVSRKINKILKNHE